MRLFYAIKIPNDIKEILYEYSNRYKDINGIKIIPRDLLHITLLFLGEVNPEELDGLHRDALKLQDMNHFSSKIYLDISGVFPNKIKPRIIWVGSKNTNKSLIKLSESMRDVFSRHIAKQKSNFYITHITVCRIKKLINKFDLIEFNDKISFDIDGFSLFQSILTSKGPIYKELNSYKFT